MDLDCSMSLVASGGGLCHRRPQCGDLPKVVGAHPCGLSHGSLLHRLLGGISKRHPRRSTYGVWQRQRLDRACRTLEQHAASAARTLCEKNLVILEVGSDARDMSTIVHSSLQPLVVSHLISPLPHFERQGGLGAAPWRAFHFLGFASQPQASQYASKRPTNAFGFST